MNAQTENEVVVKKSRFVVPQPKARVDPAALEAFAAQADVVAKPIFPVNGHDVEPTAVSPNEVKTETAVMAKSTVRTKAAVPVVPVAPLVQVIPPVVAQIVLSTDRTKAFLLRLLPEQFERIEKVFAVSSYKSKQKMGEQLLMEAVEELARKLGIE